ncbi:MAG: rod shape-determining protein RodA [Helicobacteraceae bacterium]|nr:rod shape-determining protein RodA [Helicobacteraceae bacterium]
MSLFDRRVLSHFDWILPLMVIPLAIMSLYLIYEINPDLAYKQMIYMAVAAGLFVIVFAAPIRRFYWLIPVGYWVGILLLVLVAVVGVTHGMGAQRWLKLPFVNVTFQPSEIFKPLFILMMAYLVRESPPPEEGYGWLKFLKFLFYILLPFALILREPDLGTAVLLLLTGGAILLAAGLKKRIIAAVLLAAGLGGGFFYAYGYDMLHDYQKKRIADFLSEDANYHVQQSLIAIGSGGLSGKHSGEATQTQLRFLPISTSDFIFSSFVERFGFVGALLLLGLYISIILHLFTLNAKVHNDYLASVTITGVALMIFLYMAINVAMTMGLAPVVGVPLPMFSHGGSSFINFIVLIAIVENLLVFRFNFLY